MITDPRTDQQLIAALNAGELDAFDALYFRYRDFVLRLARRWTGNDADALDVAQETFLYLAGKFPGFRLTSAMTSLLYPVVRNLSIAARKRSQRFAGDESLDRVPVESTDATDDLGDALRHLSDAHREVILMRFVDDLSLQEIADALQIPLGTVKSRLHQAIEKLRDDDRTREYFS
ncbi:MAG: sigma-70 family RNA polymerase sigma factor [bacterium]|nr:sigma-70 family RNA polymerase sigma factor [Candidatus Kapabacteria bacterium]